MKGGIFMHRKPNYLSMTGLRRRLVNVMHSAARIANGKGCSSPSVSERVYEFWMPEYPADESLIHHAKLHYADCKEIAKLLNMYDIAFQSDVKPPVCDIMGVSVSKYVRDVRRLLKALTKNINVLNKIPLSELTFLRSEMINFVHDYETDPYRKLLQLGLRDEKIKAIVRELYLKTSDPPRRVVLNMARHEDVNVRMFVVNHRDYIDVNILNLLANDSNYRIRGMASWTPEFFERILGKQVAMAEWLLSDPSGKYDYIQKRYEDDKALFALLYGKSKIPTIINATFEEYVDGMKAYFWAYNGLLNSYYKRFAPKSSHIEAIETYCDHLWWQIDIDGNRELWLRIENENNE